jgi:hypothetical protein
MARTTRSALRRATATVTSATLLLALVGCSSDDDGPEADPGSISTAPPGEPPLPTHTTMGVVSGKLDEKARARIKGKVATVVDDWVDAAYFAGGWSPDNLGRAFPHFSKRAAADAQRDARLMSNAKLGDRLESVVATKRRLRIDVLAVQRRAVGVTARFVLGMELAGEVNRAERVAGKLFLTWEDGGWQVFGYDVERGKA